MNHANKNNIKRVKTIKVSGGFSLIELMIVMVIIGILTTFAIPAYNRYVQKTKFTNAFNFANSTKVNVFEYALANSGFKGLDKADLGLDNNTNTTQLLRKANIASLVVSVSNKGAIVDLNFKIAANVAIGNGAELTLKATYTNGEVMWECLTKNFEKYYIPKSCVKTP